MHNPSRSRQRHAKLWVCLLSLHFKCLFQGTSLKSFNGLSSFNCTWKGSKHLAEELEVLVVQLQEANCMKASYFELIWLPNYVQNICLHAKASFMFLKVHHLIFYCAVPLQYSILKCKNLCYYCGCVVVVQVIVDVALFKLWLF